MAPLGNQISTATKFDPYHQQTIKFAVGPMAEAPHTWLKTSLEISVLRLLFQYLKRVPLMGQSEAPHNLLQKKRNQLMGLILDYL